MKNTYFLVKYKEGNRFKGSVLDVKQLPFNQPIYSSDIGIYIDNEFYESNTFKKIRHYWLLNSEYLKEKEVTLKSIVYSKEDKANIIKVTEANNGINFNSIHDIEPTINGVKREYTDQNNRVWITIKQYEIGKYGQYIKRYYQNTSNTPSQLLEVNYTYLENDRLEVKFHTASNLSSLEGKPFVTCVLYPEGHRKHIKWNNSWFSVTSEKALKQAMKKRL